MSAEQSATQTAKDEGASIEPQKYPTLGVLKHYTVQRLRLLGATIRKHKGGMTSDEVRSFLRLYGEELSDALDATVKDFLQKKLG